MSLCEYLRWKSRLGIEALSPDEIRASMELALVPFECLRSARSWGPDGQPCAPECCVPGGPCFEDSGLLGEPGTS